MVGHHSPRNERFGWGSARLDDVATWAPARVTALPATALVPGWRSPLPGRRVTRPEPGDIGVAGSRLTPTANLVTIGRSDPGGAEPPDHDQALGCSSRRTGREPSDAS